MFHECVQWQIYLLQIFALPISWWLLSVCLLLWCPTCLSVSTSFWLIFYSFGSWNLWCDINFLVFFWLLTKRDGNHYPQYLFIFLANRFKTRIVPFCIQCQREQKKVDRSIIMRIFHSVDWILTKTIRVTKNIIRWKIYNKLIYARICQIKKKLNDEIICDPHERTLSNWCVCLYTWIFRSNSERGFS